MPCRGWPWLRRHAGELAGRGVGAAGEADELRVDFQTTLVLRLGVRSLAAGLVVVVVRERGLGERVGLAVPLRRRGEVLQNTLFMK